MGIVVAVLIFDLLNPSVVFSELTHLSTLFHF